jgi:hypothetical protein
LNLLVQDDSMYPLEERIAVVGLDRLAQVDPGLGDLWSGGS